jgi:hypothetical protein
VPRDADVLEVLLDRLRRGEELTSVRGTMICRAVRFENWKTPFDDLAVLLGEDARPSPSWRGSSAARRPMPPPLASAEADARSIRSAAVGGRAQQPDRGNVMM